MSAPQRRDFFFCPLLYPSTRDGPCWILNKGERGKEEGRMEGREGEKKDKNMEFSAKSQQNFLPAGLLGAFIPLMY